jgi:predicted metal-dependent peptidase
MRTGVKKEATGLTVQEQEKMLQAARDSVADALTYLTSVKEQNFYARTINLLDRIAIPNYGTMGVAIHQGKYIFIYDPLFALRISADELRATCEHEVLHIILEHIPRTIQLFKIVDLDEDKEIFKMTSNLAVDLAANELLYLAWPKIKDKTKPLGFWVIPEEFDPPLPLELSYEEYHQILLKLFKERLKESPQKLWKMAKKLLEQTQKALDDAMKNQPGQPGKDGQKGDKQDGQGQGDGSEQSDAPGGEGQGSGEGQGQGQGAGQGQGSGQGSGTGGGGAQSDGDGEGEQSLSDVMNELKQLDPLDQKVVEMLAKSMKAHLAWEKGTGEEGESHKLTEHGKNLIKESLQSHDKSRGTIPGHIMELIRRMLMPPTVSWTELLHDIVQRTRQTKKTRGMSRPSKKLAALKVFAKIAEEEEDIRFKHFARHSKQLPVFPGIKHSNKFTIVYIVDTSGSMGTDELQRGLSELQHIQKADSDVRVCVMYIDTLVSKEYWVGPNDEIDENMTGRGGTDFDPGFERTLELLRSQDDAPDILIYCTDGYAPAPTVKLPIPTVWLITPRGRPVTTDAGHITIYMQDYQLEDADA